MRTCKIKDCKIKHYGLGYCRNHYKLFKSGTIDKQFCEKCKTSLRRIGKNVLCKKCRTMTCPTCGVEFISTRRRIKYCCQKCAVIDIGKRNGFDEGTRGVDCGYRRIKIGKKWIREHIYLMEQHLGRKLKKNECIHHINAIKTDNRIENLKIVTRDNHFGKVCCPYCQKQFEIK